MFYIIVFNIQKKLQYCETLLQFKIPVFYFNIIDFCVAVLNFQHHYCSESRDPLEIIIICWFIIISVFFWQYAKLHFFFHKGKKEHTCSGLQAFCDTHTHTHTHTRWLLWFTGLSIEVMLFILYKPYFLSPYNNPTPKLSPHRRLCAILLSQKKLFLYDL